MTPKNKKILIWTGFTVVTLFLGYVGYSIYRQVQLAEQMTVKLNGASLLPVTGSDLGVSITVSVKNISNLNINISELNFDIYLNDKYVNKVLQKTNQNIAPNAVSQIQFNVYVNPSDLVSGVDIAEALATLNINTLKLKIQGYFSGSVDGINIRNFPFTEESLIGDLINS